MTLTKIKSISEIMEDKLHLFDFEISNNLCKEINDLITNRIITQRISPELSIGLFIHIVDSIVKSAISLGQALSIMRNCEYNYALEILDIIYERAKEQIVEGKKKYGI